MDYTNFDSLSNILQLFFSSASLPVTIFEKDTILEKYALMHQDFNLPLLLYSSLPDDLPAIWYTSSPEYMYFGGIRLPDTDRIIFLGPVLLTDCTSRQALMIANRLGRKPNEHHMIQQYFDSTHAHSLSSIESSIRLLCVLLDLDVPSDIPQPEFHWNLPYKTKDYSLESTEEYTHDYDLERRILSCIGSGDLIGINKLFREEILPLKKGNPRDLLQIKALIISANMMASRLTMQNGVDQDRITSIQVRYHIEILSAQSMPELTECFFSLIQEYTKRNAELHELPSDSLLVRRVSQYTKGHISEKLSTHIFAEYLHVSEAYLSSHFKKETGKTISTYIQEEKVREARKLLEGSNMTLAQISNILDFSSESYFCAVFKKITGMTPESYRHA